MVLTVRAWVALGLSVGLFVFAERADAYCRKSTCTGAKCKRDENGCSIDGQKVQWKTGCVSYSFNEKGSRILDPIRSRVAVSDAFDAWNLVDCGGGKRASMSISVTNDVPCSKAQYNASGANVHVVVFRDDNWTYKEEGGAIQDTLAKTTVTFSPESGEIFDADMEVNAAYNDLTTTKDAAGAVYDLQAIITHEVGHFLAIDHSEQPTAVMGPYYDRGSIAQRKLTPDDIAALCDAYPPDRQVACNSIPRGGFEPNCNGEEDDGCTVAPRRVAPQSSASSNGALAILGLSFAYAAVRKARASSKRRTEV